MISLNSVISWVDMRKNAVLIITGLCLAIIIILMVMLVIREGGRQVEETPPVITDVMASDLTEISAVIIWSTDEPATSQVEYGTTPNYGLKSLKNENLATNHRVDLSGLTPGTKYFFKVKSTDEVGNVRAVGNFTLTTYVPAP
jgi:phosphodiesterase/alkaline phosphatase D-like protein